MCLLVFAHKGATPSIDALHTASISNPDGFGWAINTGDRILRGRGMNFDKVVSEYHQQLALTPGESMFHLRWATHGTVNKKNCHPFYVGRDSNTVLGHNGIIPIEQPKGDKRSDTRYFSESVLPRLGGACVLDSQRVVTAIEEMIGASKLVILTNNPSAKQTHYIINEHMGHWDSDGIWWSNDSYVPRIYKSYGMYGYGWDTVSEPKTCSINSQQDEWDDYVWSGMCPVCEEWYRVDERVGDTACPECNVCLVCENWANKCTCMDSWFMSDADKYNDSLES